MAMKKTFEEKYHLVGYDWSSIDGDTAFFYFSVAGRTSLLCVEWWNDENKVAELAQRFKRSGVYINYADVYLTEEEMKKFAEICYDVVTNDPDLEKLEMFG